MDIVPYKFTAPQWHAIKAQLKEQGLCSAEGCNDGRYVVVSVNGMLFKVWAKDATK